MQLIQLSHRNQFCFFLAEYSVIAFDDDDYAKLIQVATKRLAPNFKMIARSTSIAFFNLSDFLNDETFLIESGHPFGPYITYTQVT